jgi:NAD(P)-dependent dehydrogenase (short-subunit alcohol dehydrogenase family)
MQSLDGQVAIVTGAGSGIGLAIATVLRSEGAEVVVADLDAQRAHSAAVPLESVSPRMSAGPCGTWLLRKLATSRARL